MDKRCRPRTEKIKAKISETEIATQEKMRRAFLAEGLKCKECGGWFDRHSILMVCSKCLKKKYNKRYLVKRRDYGPAYREKNREKIREYERKYYEANKIKIKLRTYHLQEERKDAR